MVARKDGKKGRGYCDTEGVRNKYRKKRGKEIKKRKGKRRGRKRGRNENIKKSFLV
jgi:hypothetical protein